MSVLDRWIEKTGAEDKPSIGLPGLGSDYAPFTHLSGIPIVDVGFFANRSEDLVLLDLSHGI